ncbi:MAG: LamG-like jellyroll fold domain-containing protein [Planctomycetaceae bacterium]
MLLTPWLRRFSSRSSSRSFRRPSQRRRQHSHGHPSPVALESLEIRTLLSAGTLDLSFGNGGVVISPIPDALEGAAVDVAIQPDGKIVSVGHRQRDTNDNNNNVVVARHNSDGTLDQTFGDGGMVILSGNNWKGRAVAIDGQGRIVVAGYGGGVGLVVRLSNDGSLVTSFSDDGILGIQFPSFTHGAALNDIAIQGDGKIVVGGFAQATSLETGFAIARINVDGSFDTSFDSDGRVTSHFGPNDGVVGVHIDSLGRIVVAGGTRNQADSVPDDFRVARYNPDGTLDTSFGSAGSTRLNVSVLGNWATAVDVDANDRIIVVTNAGYLVRLDDGGMLDSAFGGGDGIVTFPEWHIDDLELQPDGRIITSGRVGPQARVVRFNVDGSFDTSFGSSGSALAPPFGNVSQFNGVALQADGNIVAVGFNPNDDDPAPYNSIGLVRFHAVRPENPPVEIPPVPGLVSWWPADGNTNDVISGFDGTAINGVTLGPGQSGQAFALDGLNDFVRIGDKLDPELGSFSVSAWVKKTAAPAESTVIRKGLGGSFNTTGYGLSAPGSAISFTVGDGANVVTAVLHAPLALNEFQHLAGVLDRDNKLVQLYLDGELVAEESYTTLGNIDTPMSLAIGALDKGNELNQLFPGLIDDVMYFGRALSTAEIKVAANINQLPAIGSQSFNVDENQSSAGTVVASDTDLPDDTLTFSITGNGVDDALFAITAGGALSFLTAPDYENPLDANGDNIYEVEVRVTDSVGASAVATMTVNVLNQTATISGTVFVDADGDGLFDGGAESAIDGVTVELLDSALATVATDVTELGGVYAFTVDDELGTYRIRETQPTGVDDGAAILGDAGGTVISSNEMQLTLTGVDASDYDFTEVGLAVQAGDTATIGFWQNKHGQGLIAQGGPALVGWLNTNFGNIFGSTFSDGSGGDDAAEVAGFYRNEFFKKKLTGSSKVDAQFMATALATFFTSSNLSGGSVAAGYGFNVTETGIGTKIINVGASGAAFDVADDTEMTIMALLVATNSLTDIDGLFNNDDDGYSHVYDLNGDGILDDYEKSLRAMANNVYSAINEQGDI